MVWHRGRLVGEYRLVERLGQGGMGSVWRARDDALERDVAIKMSLPSADGCVERENSSRLLIEAKAEACIKSRHVAQVLQLGCTDDGDAYVVMELLDGESLHDLLARQRRLPPARAVHIARQIAKGIAAAHELGIVHRDLKPANVMLVHADGDDDVVKIVDFGIAKRTRSSDEALTQTGAVIGTLQFMAPEQVDGGDVDARSDIYSLGVVLFRMLAGRSTFESDSLRELSEAIVTAPPPSLEALGIAVPSALDAVVRRCLEKKPADRFASMIDVERALAGSLVDDDRRDETASFYNSKEPALPPQLEPTLALQGVFDDDDEPSAAPRQPAARRTRVVGAAAAAIGIVAVGLAVAAWAGTAASSTPRAIALADSAGDIVVAAPASAAPASTPGAFVAHAVEPVPAASSVSLDRAVTPPPSAPSSTALPPTIAPRGGPIAGAVTKHADLGVAAGFIHVRTKGAQ